METISLCPFINHDKCLNTSIFLLWHTTNKQIEVYGKWEGEQEQKPLELRQINEEKKKKKNPNPLILHRLTYSLHQKQEMHL